MGIAGLNFLTPLLLLVETLVLVWDLMLFCTWILPRQLIPGLVFPSNFILVQNYCGCFTSRLGDVAGSEALQKLPFLAPIGFRSRYQSLCMALFEITFEHIKKQLPLKRRFSIHTFQKGYLVGSAPQLTVFLPLWPHKLVLGACA